VAAASRGRAEGSPRSVTGRFPARDVPMTRPPTAGPGAAGRVSSPRR